MGTYTRSLVALSHRSVVAVGGMFVRVGGWERSEGKDWCTELMSVRRSSTIVSSGFWSTACEREVRGREKEERKEVGREEGGRERGRR